MARVDDRWVISGIVHVLLSSGRWVDAPGVYGPRKTLYNRWVRWVRAGVWRRGFQELTAAGGPASDPMLESTHATAHCCAAAGGQGEVLNQAISRSRGERTANLHALVDGYGRPVVLAIMRGQRGDAPITIDLIHQAAIAYPGSRCSL